MGRKPCPIIIFCPVGTKQTLWHSTVVRKPSLQVGSERTQRFRLPDSWASPLAVAPYFQFRRAGAIGCVSPESRPYLPESQYFIVVLPKMVSMKKFFFGLILLASRVGAQVPSNIESTLVLLNIKTGEEKAILTQKRHFEAPNWSRDGKFLIINADGFLEKIDLEGQPLGQINPQVVNECNNDHGLSFDGQMLVFSKNDTSLAPHTNSRIYLVLLSGGPARLVTEAFPSYWHGISPDGQSLVYCANRNGQWDVYRIGANGGPETRLTDTPGLDDGPEYSYDGQWIYFNSHRTGRMHLYRMRPDGSQQAQLTTDEFDNWFAHPSPNGKQVVYIAYLKDQKGSHPFGQEVKLRLLNLKTLKAKDLTPVFYGGQGSLNVPSWSPDGRWVAYVRYREL
jgi:TolB protein